MSLVTIKTFRNHIEAEIAKNENTSLVYAGALAIELQVIEEDAEKALSILKHGQRK